MKGDEAGGVIFLCIQKLSFEGSKRRIGKSGIKVLPKTGARCSGRKLHYHLRDPQKHCGDCETGAETAGGEKVAIREKMCLKLQSRHRGSEKTSSMLPSDHRVEIRELKKKNGCPSRTGQGSKIVTSEALLDSTPSETAVKSGQGVSVRNAGGVFGFADVSLKRGIAKSEMGEIERTNFKTTWQQ